MYAKHIIARIRCLKLERVSKWRRRDLHTKSGVVLLRGAEEIIDFFWIDEVVLIFKDIFGFDIHLRSLHFVFGGVITSTVFKSTLGALICISLARLPSTWSTL